MRNPAELLNQIKGRVPNSLYEELEYQVTLHNQGDLRKPVLDSLFRDALVHLRETANTPMVRAERTSTGIAYRINEEEEEDEGGEERPLFGLLSEPTEEGCFASSFHDVIQEHTEVYRPEDPLEQKGRICPPLCLDLYPDFIVEDNRRVCGCDIAAFGDDKSVLAIRVGIHIADIQSYYHRDPNEMAGRVMLAIEEFKLDEVVFDSTGGWGDAVYRELVNCNVEELCLLTPIHFNQKPRGEKFNVPNARAEMYFLLAERFRAGRITLPRHKEALEELSWIKYKVTPAGQFAIQLKEMCKRDNKRSPDHADAIALAFYCDSGLEVY